MTTQGSVRPGARLSRRWVLRNLGVQIWPKGTQLIRLNGGDEGLALATTYLPKVAPCPPKQDITIELEFVAPEDEGAHVAYFRLADREGREFGQRLWLMVRVEDGAHMVEDDSDLPPSVAEARQLAAYGRRLPSIVRHCRALTSHCIFTDFP